MVMEVHLYSAFSVRFSCSAGKLSPNKKPDSKTDSQVQFRKLSEKDLSRILRKESAVLAVERKANSSKYSNLWPKSVLEALSDSIKHNRWELALKIFSLLRKQQWYEPRCSTYAKLLTMLGKCKQPKEATLLYETMAVDGLEPTIDVYTAMVSAYGSNGLFDDALSLIEDMKSVRNCKPDVVTYTALIKSCLKFHRFDTIDSILAEMSLLGIECTTVTYNVIIDGYGKAKCFQRMEKTLGIMIRSGECKPDVYTFNSVIGAYGACGRIFEMEKWYEEFQKMGLSPDVMTYNILIRSYGGCGSYEKMASVLEFMDKRFYSPTTVTYNVMIEAFGKGGEIEKMDEVFLKMKHGGLKPNSITYSSLVCAYGKAGLVEKVDSVLRQVENSDVVLDTTFYNCVVGAYGNMGDVEKMTEVFVGMEGNGCRPDEITFSTAVKAYRENWMVEAARKIERKWIGRKDRLSINA